MKIVSAIWLVFLFVTTNAQDTTVLVDNLPFTLREVVVRNNMDYKSILQRIQNDTTFYKAFRNLRVIEFSSFNDIRMLDKKDKPKATYYSKTRQHRENGCRTTEVIEQKTTGNFFDKNGDYNYTTAEMYAGLFFAKGKVCGENNIVAGRNFSTADKSGMEKHKEQLKMLFFNPGKKIPGIPLIGNKLDLYDENAHKYYDYNLNFDFYKGNETYIFSIKPKEDLGLFQRDNIVVDEMVTWFDARTMEVLARKYTLSYKAGIYSFNVNMEVEMTKFGNMLVPQTLRYKGEFNAVVKKKEKGEFTATLFDFKK